MFYLFHIFISKKNFFFKEGIALSNIVHPKQVWKEKEKEWREVGFFYKLLLPLQNLSPRLYFTVTSLGLGVSLKGRAMEAFGIQYT